MAKQTPRTDANDQMPSAQPSPTRPERASGRRRRNRETDSAERETASDARNVTSDDAAAVARPGTYSDQPADDPSDESTSEMHESSMQAEPSDEEIRLRAYQRYLERGGGHGLEFEDWVEAERELRTRH